MLEELPSGQDNYVVFISKGSDRPDYFPYSFGISSSSS
jgi:hypothetical protein